MHSWRDLRYRARRPPPRPPPPNPPPAAAPPPGRASPTRDVVDGRAAPLLTCPGCLFDFHAVPPDPAPCEGRLTFPVLTLPRLMLPVLMFVLRLTVMSFPP